MYGPCRAIRSLLLSCLVGTGVPHSASSQPAPSPDAAPLSPADETLALEEAEPAVSATQPSLPGPLFWAYGLRDPDDLPAYAGLGLNTIHIDVPLDTQGTHPVVLQFIRAAGTHGLQVIVGIPTGLGRGRDGERDPITPYGESYMSEVDQFIRAIVTAYRDEPAVIGWATEHHPGTQIAYSDADFQRNLQEYHTSVAELNTAWGAQFATFRGIRMAEAQRDADQPFQVGPRSLAVAEYRRDAFATLHRRWLRSIRQCDESRPIFTGRLHLYRSLSSVPTEYDCVVSDSTSPPVGADPQTKAVERVAIARHGGLCAAIPCVPLPPAASQAPRVRALKTWLALAAIHGASGVAFPSWELLRRETQELRQGLQELLTDPDFVRLFEMRPEASAAILYEPYMPVALQLGIGFYGYLDVPGELAAAMLLTSCRLPSAYGTVDVLAADDLEKVELSRYGAILAPRAFNVPEMAQEALELYVEGGGAFLADLGVGLSQTGSWTEMPPRLMALFGIEEIARLQNTYSGGWQAGNGFVGTTVPEFPSLRAGARTSGTAKWQGGNAAFEGLHAMVAPIWETDIILSILAEVRGDTPKPRPRRRSRRQRAVQPEQKVVALSSGILMNRYGEGLGLHATTRMWESWPSTDPLYQALLRDLFVRRANTVLQTAEGLYPQSVLAGACDRGIWVYNTGTVSTEVRLLALNAESRVYLGAAARCSAAFRRPGGIPAGGEHLTLRVPGESITVVDAIPVAVEPLTDAVTTIGRSYGPDRIEFDVGGGDAQVTARRGGEIGLHARVAVRARVTVDSGDYETPARSRHRVTLTQHAGRREAVTLELEADDKDRLRFTRPLVRHTVVIEPIVQQ